VPLFLRVPRLVEELAVARVSGAYAQTLARIGKIDVLVLDDLVLTPMKDAERRDLLEVLEDRYDRCSMRKKKGLSATKEPESNP
jgi:DNA replication protein DnaC